MSLFFSWSWSNLGLKWEKKKNLYTRRVAIGGRSEEHTSELQSQ